ncbi:hypothetical protein HYFRA_00005880 [Hymenoscyphus fraxineus]|uniref:Uncharacterized protein n=1 Tax=Hymenoscyphus fraxineus TaxID=746836 RepID=A0A9N9PSK4_9HELO|nr:hypothetical protein HYFRA_00005880 [Hymenoscyphus fraxineus]
MADLNLDPALTELLNRVGGTKDFTKEHLVHETLHDIKIMGGYFGNLTKCKLSNCIVAPEYHYSPLKLSSCRVDKCILVGAYVNSKSILQNTILLDCEVKDSELRDCIIIQSSVQRTKVDNCKIRKTTELDWKLNLPSLWDFNNWDQGLDTFPLDIASLNSPYYSTPTEPVEISPHWKDLRFVDCQITRSETSEAEISLSKVSSGLASNCEIRGTIITHLTAHNCSIKYSELRGSRVEESIMVHCLLKACTEDGQIIKHRASGVSLSVIPREIRMQIFGYVIDEVWDYSKMPALVVAFLTTPELCEEALHILPQKKIFQLQFPGSFDDSHLIPFDLLRRLSFRGDKEALYKSAELRYFPPSLLTKYRGDYPRVPQLIDLHMSISARDEAQVQADFRVITDFARKHSLERFSITHEEKNEHHTIYQAEPPHKAVLRQYISNEIDKITRELEIEPRRESMTIYELNGHNLPGEPSLYIPKHNWGGYQYTWTWISDKGTALKWKYEN